MTCSIFVVLDLPSVLSVSIVCLSLIFCSFRSLCPLIIFTRLTFSLFCDLPMYLTVYPSFEVLSEDKVFSLPVFIFNLISSVCTILSILPIFCLFIWPFLSPIFCVPAGSSIHPGDPSVLLLFSFSVFCLSILSFLCGSDFPRHVPSVRLSTLSIYSTHFSAHVHNPLSLNFFVYNVILRLLLKCYPLSHFSPSLLAE